METENGLKIECVPSGRTGMATLTVKLGNDVLAVESLNVTKSKARTDFAKTICDGREGIERKVVDEKLLQLAAEVAKPKEIAPTEGSSASDPKVLLASMPKSARVEARKMLENPNLLKCVTDDITALGVAGERMLAMMLYLVGTSRLLNRPLAVIIQGPTSSGKSHVAEKAAILFPDEAVIYATQMTPQALFHMKPGSLCHRFIVAGERSKLQNDEASEATRALREMLSAGRLVKLMPIKVNGEIQTMSIEQDGPISYVESTTLTKIMVEDANRCVLLNTDERSKQTRKIIEQTAAFYSGKALGGQVEQVILRHHAAQRMLKPYTVVIPYAKDLGVMFDDKRVETRRAFPQLMSLIQASALLHQRQREIDDDGRLLADPYDYEVARWLLLKPMSRLLGGQVSDPALRFHIRLLDWFDSGQTFNTTEARKKEAGSKSSVNGWLRELQEEEMVELLEPGRGAKPAEWKVLPESEAKRVPTILPTMDQLFGD